MAYLALAGLLLVGGYTVTLAFAEFKRGNHLGGVGLSVAAIATMALGAYEVFFW